MIASLGVLAVAALAMVPLVRRALAARQGGVCEHSPTGPIPVPQADACQECGAGFSLRVCSTCGYVGCCESQGGHARRHALDAGHPVIKSLPVGAGFTWCYGCGAYTG